MFGFLAALTRSVELVTGVIILPQRQTALVAKQAAEVDLLSGGRLRLGIGIGWNAVEYEALGEDFGNRGKRSAEQVELLRRLWTEQTVTFDGSFHRVTGAGLAPTAGATADPGVDRGEVDPGLPACRTAGRRLVPHDGAGTGTRRRPRGRRRRRPSQRVAIPRRSAWKDACPGTATPAAVRSELAAWSAAGASHVSINTMGSGLATARRAPERAGHGGGIAGFGLGKVAAVPESS